jgi:hypothetical protein
MGTLRREIIEGAVLMVHRVHLCGGVSYRHTGHRLRVEERSETAEWETIRHVPDVDELKEARRLRGEIARRLDRLGARTALGVAVRAGEEEAAEKAVAEVEQEIREFNRRSVYSRLDLDVAFFRVTSDNERAAAMIVRDLAQLLDDLRAALEDADPGDIRSVARKLAGFSEVVVPEVGGLISKAVEAAKKEAAKIAEAARGTAEEYAAAVGSVSFSPVDLARFALEEPDPSADAPAAPSVGSGRVMEI